MVSRWRFWLFNKGDYRIRRAVRLEGKAAVQEDGPSPLYHSLDLTACLARLHRPRVERRPAPRGWRGLRRVGWGESEEIEGKRPVAAADGPELLHV